MSYANTVSKNIPPTNVQPAQIQPQASNSLINSPLEFSNLLSKIIMQLEQIKQLSKELNMPALGPFIQSFLPNFQPNAAPQVAPQTSTTTVPIQSFKNLTINSTNIPNPSTTQNIPNLNATKNHQQNSTHISTVTMNSTNPP